MKRLTLAVLTLLMAINFWGQPSSAAVPKVGEACKKIGITTVLRGKTLVCKTSGSSPKWQLGKVSTPTPEAQPKPTPATPSLDNLLSFDVRSVAYKQVMSRIETSISAKATTLEISAGPGVKPSELQIWRENMLRMSRFLSETWLIPNVSVQIESGLDNGEGINCNRGHVNLPNAIYMCITPVSENVQYFGGIAAHEYVHLMQGAFKSINTIWFAEGSATYLGDAVAHPSTGTVDQYFTYEMDRSRRDGRSIALTRGYLYSTSTIVKMFHDLEIAHYDDPQVTAQNATISYWAGSLATEALVAVYGINKFLDFNSQIGKLGFAEAFQSEFSISPDTFYEKIAPYVLSTP
jgi:hypothetical protein